VSGQEQFKFEVLYGFVDEDKADKEGEAGPGGIDAA